MIARVPVEGRRAVDEDRAVLRLCGLIVFSSLLAIALRHPATANSPPEPSPYMAVFSDLPGPHQLLFREVQEGLTEAENSRSQSGVWPTPAALAAEGVPPFADLPPLKWTQLHEGFDTEYLGTSAGTSALAVIQEPDPRFGGDPAGTPEDEVHRRLRDGTMLHVSIWLRDGEPPSASELIRRPYATGWRQVVIDARAAAGITPP